MSSESIENILESLHPFERECLRIYQEQDTKILTANEIESHSKSLNLNQANRGISWLQEKQILLVTSNKLERFLPTKLGKKILEEGFPEKKLLKWLFEYNKPIKIQELAKNSGLESSEYKAAFGILKKGQHLIIDKGMVKISPKGIKEVKKNNKSQSEIVLENFVNNPELEINNISSETLEDLKKRGMLEKTAQTIVSAALTNYGTKILKKFSDEKIDYIDQLNSEIIQSGDWQNLKLRPYKVDAPVPPYHPGKRHFYWQTIDYVRQVWLSLGFEEMEGTVVQTSFWNFDALFTPQDHTVREEQDTFFIKSPKSGRVDEEIYEHVKNTHLHGGSTGSTGWKGKFIKEISESLILRTHTTCLSAQTIKKLRSKGYPAKYFAIGRCFRNEKIDWTHLAEFDQVEGIVVDPDVTFQDLMGYLRAFYLALGYKEVRFRPGYYPYTEPSMGIEVLHPIKNEWIELGGSGVFRPEVVVPILGEDIPVLAWGPGISRIVSERYAAYIKDIRTLYENYIDQLRDAPLWLH